MGVMYSVVNYDVLVYGSFRCRWFKLLP